MNAVVNKIENILTHQYDIKNYVDLVEEIFPKIKIVAPDKFNREFSNFNSHIEGSVHVGTFNTPDDKKIIVMAVELKKAGYVESSRSTQRSYAKKLIENGNADAAFIAFYTKDDPRWRLSLVRLDYEMKVENGKLQVAENMTPAKRYSYLVGENEPCHTAIRRFERFIVDSIANPEHPTLDDLEEAFSVEKVTNEFFTLYCDKFHQLREKLEENEDFQIEAKQHNFTSAQFAKKLMGQIVFLYFLQKKGWLGVKAWPDTLTEKEYQNAYYARGAKSRELIPIVYKPIGNGLYKTSPSRLDMISDEDQAELAQCVKGKPWGTGPHKFMRRLFEHAEDKNLNFYDELLEPLFYEALNKNRGEQGYCAKLHCRIPFLSGGLFEPIDGYEWKNNNFNLPNEIFSNESIKGKRDADGILDIFDRYNFTMSEDEPMEREVAIDPEMLGKVFENLLEINDRKSKGAFYTPREIVHYMCQESLINYLTNTLNIEEEAIRDFILYGDFMKDEDTVKEKRQGNGGMYISEKLFKINPDGTVAVDRLKDMDEALKNVRVADPAVGSGAFPLGMLNEIVRARQNISAYMAINMNAFNKHWMYNNERSPYWLKYETIRNCIFACDIEPSAVDIAQLRLWLSLVIDDETNPNAQNEGEGHKNPLPLPNLENNILCGNSLIDELDEIKLIKETELIGNEEYQTQLGQSEYETVVKALIEKQNEFFCCDNTDKKKQLKGQIESLRDIIIMQQLRSCKEETIQKYNESKHMASRPYMLWQLDFARVFREKGGFDIVIGNPPYGIVFDEELKASYEKDYPTFKRNNDLYVAFYEKSIQLSSNNGVISLITPNTYLNGDYFKKLRMLLKTDTKVISVIDYKNNTVFADPTVYVAVGIFAKVVPTFEYDFRMRVAQENIYTFVDYVVSVNAASDEAIKPGNPLFQRILKKTTFHLEEKFDVKDVGFNYWSKGKGKVRGGSIGSRVLYSGDKLHEDDTPYLKGRDIDRYWKGLPSNYLRHNYSEYLVEGDTFRFSAEVMESKKKIIYRQTANRLIATVDDEGLYNDKTIHCIIPKVNDARHLYLLGLLNSHLFVYLYREISQETEGRAFSQVKTVYVKKLPIIIPEDEAVVDRIEELVKMILSQKKELESADTTTYEDEIDKLVYQTYGVSPAEIE